MAKDFGPGSNIKDVKNYNRALILKMICTNPPISRSQLALRTKLAKMTLSNIVSELIGNGIISEQKILPINTGGTIGRRPILLDISERSPCVCGMLIKRGLCQVILADLRGHVFDSINTNFEKLNSSGDLFDILLNSYFTLQKRCDRKIIAISVSSVGPLDSAKGIILNPINFYGLTNIPIVDVIKSKTDKCTFLINDANAGALAEKIYGYGKNVTNFVYLHIMNGIGAGLVLDDKLYEGNTGQSSEFGHSSINFAGPACSCGNFGCVDLYANTNRMKESANASRFIYPDSKLFSKQELIWNDYVNFANQKDPLSMIVLEQFCNFVSYALTNVLNIINANLVLIGYDCETPGDFIERAISSRINKFVIYSSYHSIEVRRSAFEGDAPLIGSVAMVTNKIFNRELDRDSNNIEKIDSILFD
jgi:transcriptional regulator of PTS gene